MVYPGTGVVAVVMSGGLEDGRAGVVVVVVLVVTGGWYGWVSSRISAAEATGLRPLGLKSDEELRQVEM
jgi:hypothetical protein